MIRTDVLAHQLEKDGYKTEVIEEIVHSIKMTRTFEELRDDLIGKR